MIPIYSKSLRIRKTLELYIICNDPADHRMLTGVQNILHKQTNESQSLQHIVLNKNLGLCGCYFSFEHAFGTEPRHVPTLNSWASSDKKLNRKLIQHQGAFFGFDSCFHFEACKIQEVYGNDFKMGIKIENGKPYFLPH